MEINCLKLKKGKLKIKELLKILVRLDEQDPSVQPSEQV